MEAKMSRAWVEINLDVFKNNLMIIKNHISDNVKMLAVIKADGYGHGAVELARVCEENNVDYFAVACVNEGIELRNVGITCPILILSYVDISEIDDIINHNLIPTAYDYEFPKILNDHLISLNKNMKIHIKLDTGMTRLGFNWNDIDNTVREIVKISKLSNIEIEGMFTHYADSDNEDLGYCNLQYERYVKISDALKKEGVSIPVCHTCNSAGVIASKEKYLDMVRCGIMLYGYYPEPHLEKRMPGLKPFLSWKAKISQVRDVIEPVTVSYGRTNKALSGEKLGVVSVGYADGFSRNLSNKFYVLVNGKKAPITGRVCMDQIIVDLTGIDGVKKGDTVTIIGKDGNEEITADDIAKALNTISYEVLCDIGKRVPRFYVNN